VALFFLALPSIYPGHPLLAAGPKIHTVTLGAYRKVPYTQPDATPDTKVDETTSLKVRPLFVDDRQKEWTIGEIHEVTDRTFTVRRALRLNDALPNDTAPHWIWQPGPWLSVDRVTGHITVLHLPCSTCPTSTSPSPMWFGSATMRHTAASPRLPREDFMPLWPSWERIGR
jgi:hypothetical protein